MFDADNNGDRMVNIPREAAWTLAHCDRFAVLITRWQEGFRNYPPDNYERVMAVLDRLATSVARFTEDIQRDVRAFIPLEDGWEYIEALAEDYPYIAKYILWGERDE